MLIEGEKPGFLTGAVASLFLPCLIQSLSCAPARAAACPVVSPELGARPATSAAAASGVLRLPGSCRPSCQEGSTRGVNIPNSRCASPATLPQPPVTPRRGCGLCTGSQHRASHGVAAKPRLGFVESTKVPDFSCHVGGGTGEGTARGAAGHHRMPPLLVAAPSHPRSAQLRQLGADGEASPGPPPSFSPSSQWVSKVLAGRYFSPVPIKLSCAFSAFLLLSQLLPLLSPTAAAGHSPPLTCRGHVWVLGTLPPPPGGRDLAELL